MHVCYIDKSQVGLFSSYIVPISHLYEVFAMHVCYIINSKVDWPFFPSLSRFLFF